MTMIKSLENHWTLKSNPSECHLLISSNEYHLVSVRNNFDDHISDIWKKACGKLNVLARIQPFIGFPFIHKYTTEAKVFHF